MNEREAQVVTDMSLNVRTLVGFSLVLSLLAVGSIRGADAQAGHFRVALSALGDSGINGKSLLVAGRDRVIAEIDAENLTPKNAYTVWFIYIDNPANCQTPDCSDASPVGNDPLVVFGRMDSLVADKTGSAHFSGNLRGFRLSKGSLVQLLVFGHGMASETDNRYRARQLLTPQDPGLGDAMGAPIDGPVGQGVAIAVFNVQE